MADQFQIPPESLSSLTSSNNSFIIDEQKISNVNGRKPKRYQIPMESDANNNPQTTGSKAPAPPLPLQSSATTISSISFSNDNRKPIGKSIPIPISTNRRNGHLKMNMADSMMHNDRYNSTNSLHNFDLIGSNDYNENIFTGNTKTKPVRRSINILSVFVLDLFAVVLLAIMACLLRFTDQFKPVSYIHQYLCHSLWTDYYNFTQKDYNSLLYHNLSDMAFYSITFISPLVIIFLAELTRLVIQLITNSNNDERIMFNYHSAMKISVPMLVRRILRIITGFLIGFFVTTIIVDVLKLQIVSFRPYTLTEMPNICNNNGTLDPNIIHQYLGSFPSLVSTLSTYTGLFLILYLTAALSQRGLRGIRAILLLIIFLLSILLSISRVTTFRNHPIDVVVGIIIGTLVALYITFMHLNSFSNRMSMTNFFNARPNISLNGGSSNVSATFDKQTLDPDDPVIWKNFRIPRAQQTRSRMADSNLSRNPSFRMSQRNRPNSYINPAFRIDADR